MTEAPLSRELALRIGLAARALPDMSVGEMLETLDIAVGLPLSDAKLADLKMKDFRKAGGEKLMSVEAETLKAALDELKGKASDAPAEVLPKTQDYVEGDMPGSIRVALASNSSLELNGHFGSCSRFLIYQVSADESRLIDIRSTAEPEDEEVEDKNAFRAGLISDCQVLHVVSIGGPAAAKVVKTSVHPIKHPNGGPAADIIAELQKVLAGTPPPWLARVMGQEAETLAEFKQNALEEEANG